MASSSAHSQASSFRRIPRGVLLALAVVVVLVLVLAIFPWSWLAGPIERKVARHTGRAFDISGRFDVDFFPLTLQAEHVTLGNAAWSKTRQMGEAHDVALQLKFWKALRGEWELPALHAKRVELLLERNAEGRTNWRFRDDAKNRKAANVPDIGQLLVEAGELRVRDAMRNTDIRLDVATEKPAKPGDRAPFVTKGEGTYRGAPFSLEGRAESPLELRDKERPYRLDVRARAGATRAHARGELTAPMQLSGFDVAFELSGNNLADLFPLAGVAVPDTPPYRLDGRLSRDDDVWRYADFTGKVGDSDLAGTAVVDLSHARPKLLGKFTSEQLLFRDLAGFLGGTPGKTPLQAARDSGTHRVFPDKPYDLAKLRAMDAEVTLRAAHVEMQPLPLESMTAALTLDNGVLTLDPLDIGFAGGTGSTKIRLDARTDPISTRADITLRQMELPKLFPKAKLTADSVGSLGGRISLEGRGNSVARMLGNANGEVGIAMGRGRISNLLLEFAGIDIAEILKFKLGRDRLITVRCAYADFGVKDGLMNVQAFAFDTTDTVVYGEGNIDLEEESLALRLLPEPKDKSPLSLRSPLRVSGTFANPDFGPEKGALTLRAIAAAALYAIAPPAALIGLVDTGPGEDTDCGKSTGKKPADAKS